MRHFYSQFLIANKGTRTRMNSNSRKSRQKVDNVYFLSGRRERNRTHWWFVACVRTCYLNSLCDTWQMRGRWTYRRSGGSRRPSSFKREGIPIKNHDVQSLIRWIHVPCPGGFQTGARGELSLIAAAPADGAGLFTSDTNLGWNVTAM